MPLQHPHAPRSGFPPPFPVRGEAEIPARGAGHCSDNSYWDNSNTPSTAWGSLRTHILQAGLERLIRAPFVPEGGEVKL